MLFHVIGNIRFYVSQRNQVRHSSDLFTQGPCFCLRCGLQLHLIRRARFPQSTHLGQRLNSSPILIWKVAAASPLVQGYPGKVCFQALLSLNMLLRFLKVSFTMVDGRRRLCFVRLKLHTFPSTGFPNLVGRCSKLRDHIKKTRKSLVFCQMRGGLAKD